MPYISNEEIEKARTPAELLEWVTSSIDAIASTEDGIRAIRMRRGECKPLIEEIYPLARWAARFFEDRADCVITPKLGSQNYDAVVSLTNVDAYTSLFVEVTQAHMGESEHHRLIHLQEHGWAPGPLSMMKKRGTEKVGLDVQPGRIVTTMEESIRITEQLITQAIQRKTKKRYEPTTVLLVAFEDFVISKEPAIERRLLDCMKEAAASEMHFFEGIYLVGMSGKLLIEGPRCSL